MRISYLSREGAGLAQTLDVAPGTTVGEFLRVHNVDMSRSTVRLARDGGADRFTPTADIELRDGDQLTVQPAKIDGAAGKAAGKSAKAVK